MSMELLMAIALFLMACGFLGVAFVIRLMQHRARRRSHA